MPTQTITLPVCCGPTVAMAQDKQPVMIKLSAKPEITRASRSSASAPDAPSEGVVETN
jgi:hypothetical protein